MINYNVWNDGSLTAAYGRCQRERQSQSQFYKDMRDDLLAETRKLIDQAIEIKIKNEASPALKEFQRDLQSIFK